MNKHIETIKLTRVFMLDLLKDFSAEQLNEVPENFSNNIIWNIGHVIMAQQGVCYVRAGLEPAVDKSLTAPYRSGTKPEQLVDAATIELLKETCISSLKKFNDDYEKNLFVNYTPWATRYGVTIENIEDAIRFLPYHEGLHTGAVIALKKWIKK